MLVRREPQQDRSRATREALLEACIHSLAEVGWAGTTVVAVAARAGVSRGAAQHHFATRDDLVRAALDRVGNDLIRSMRERGQATPHQDRMRTVLELFTGMWDQPVGRAAMQVWLAAANDPDLAALALPLERHLTHQLTALAFELLDVDPDDPGARQAVRLTLDVARGIGLGSLVRRNLPARRDDLAQWATVLATVPGLG